MFKRDYFLMAMSMGLYKHKRWILEAFAVTRANPETPGYTHQLTTIEDGRYAMVDKEQEDGVQIIEDAMPGEPLFRPLEKLILRPGDLPNVRETVVTTYGNALVNQLVLIYPFGEKIAFMTGRMDIRAIEKIIQRRWDDKATNEGDDPEKWPLTTAEYHKFNEAVGQLPGLNQLCVPSATRKTMTADPAMIKRRDELLAQHKDELHDPVVISRIVDELTKMDRAWMKGDPGDRFYVKAKSYDVVRLKVFIMQGISTGFGEAGDLIPTSLDEAWDISKLPAMVNQLRDGSFSRGAQTALGGVEVKFNNRIFQNSSIVEDDCGSKRGIRVLMTAEKAPYYQSNYQLVNGKPVSLTEERLAGLVGQYIEVRSPAYCRSPGANFCVKCMGDNIASTPEALSAYAAEIGSIFMALFMAAMHGKSMKTVKLDLATMLS